MRRKVRSGRSRVDEKILEGFLTNETSFLTAEEVKALVGTMRITVEELIAQLVPWIKNRAVVPVSKFKVGAVVRGNSGNLYLGVNIEFTDQPLMSTIHAEQAALANAMSHGETGIRALAVNEPPCGHCRQFLNELNTADELTVHIVGKTDKSLNDLLPDSFGPLNLKKGIRLLDPLDNKLRIDAENPDQLVTEALQAANASYAPYSESLAGVAIKTKNGQIFRGNYMENAAYNPSLLPLQAALANLIIAGRKFPEIEKAVLVESKDNRFDHAGSARRLLHSISGCSLEVIEASKS